MVIGRLICGLLLITSCRVSALTRSNGVFKIQGININRTRVCDPAHFINHAPSCRSTLLLIIINYCTKYRLTLSLTTFFPAPSPGAREQTKITKTKYFIPVYGNERIAKDYGNVRISLQDNRAGLVVGVANKETL